MPQKYKSKVRKKEKMKHAHIEIVERQQSEETALKDLSDSGYKADEVRLR